MHYMARIFVKHAWLAVFFVAMQAGAVETLVTAAVDNGVTPPPAAAEAEKMDVPGYFKPNPSPARVAPAEADSNSTPWMLLAGGVGLGLVFFGLGRHFGVSAARQATPHPASSALRVKPAAARMSRPGGAEGSEESGHWITLDRVTTVTVDEVSSVQEEAEVFLLLGRFDMAIGVLRHHVEAHQAAPAHVWMSLLDALHAQGLRQEFEKLAAEVHERFNVALPTWEDANARGNDLTGLERFPHLFAKITACWNSPDCLDYVRGLTQDNRNGERSGFHLEAFRELLMLIGVLENREKMAESQAIVV